MRPFSFQKQKRCPFPLLKHPSLFQKQKVLHFGVGGVSPVKKKDGARRPFSHRSGGPGVANFQGALQEGSHLETGSGAGSEGSPRVGLGSSLFFLVGTQIIGILVLFYFFCFIYFFGGGWSPSSCGFKGTPKGQPPVWQKRHSHLEDGLGNKKKRKGTVDIGTAAPETAGPSHSAEPTGSLSFPKRELLPNMRFCW